MTVDALVEEFKKVPEFSHVPENQLRWLADRGEVKEFAEGGKVFASGTPVENMLIILKGAVDLVFERVGNPVSFGIMERGEISGLLPYSRMKTALANAVAVEDSAVFFLSRSFFPEMIVQHFELTESLVHAMTDRVRDFTRQQQQDDKIMALGKLSAGLAHEMNNPSASVVRNAQELKKHLAHVPEKFKAVIKIQGTDEIVDRVNAFVSSKRGECTKHTLSMMEKAEREDEITDWLADHNVDDDLQMAENLTEFNVTIDELNMLDGMLRAEDRSAVINWVNQALVTERLVSDIQEAARRINTLVCSVKGYTHMDHAPVKQLADIHPGIQNTLTLLNHKVKHNQVKLVLNFAPDLPQANIFVSELNQVWMNLLDNALDALEGGTNNQLEVTTQRNREFIWVYITDNGPGIPADILDKIFDPFFTTKPIGRGTGLGLQVVRQIINQHNGKIEVKSVPGRTEFKVCIPIS